MKLFSRFQRPVVFLAVLLVVNAVVPVSSRIAIAADAPDAFGAESNPTGNPIGGGEGYSAVVNTPTTIVNSAEDLARALDSAESGDVVYVDDDADLDMSTASLPLVLKAGVTLASGRGKRTDGTVSQGARLVLDKPGATLIRVDGAGARITGLRLDGSDYAPGTDSYDPEVTNGIDSWGFPVEVDNNEIYGWSYAAISLLDGYIHHNYIHHNIRTGLGYGIVLGGSQAEGVVAEANIFDWNRHSIASSGDYRAKYEARYNLVLENALSAPFDMHPNAGCVDPDGPTPEAAFDCAGNTIMIHHNTIASLVNPNTHAPINAIDIYDKPITGAYVYNNWFYNPDPLFGVVQKNHEGHMFVGKNKYGTGDYHTGVSRYRASELIFHDSEPTAVTAGRTVQGFDDYHVEFLAQQAGDFITYAFNAPADMQYNFTMFAYNDQTIPAGDPSGGIADIYIDDDAAPIGSVDFSTGIFNQVVGTKALSSGTHNVTFKITGKSPNSTGYKANLTIFRMERASYSVQADRQELAVGDKVQLKSSYGLIGSVITSDHASVAAVDGSGLVTAVAKGTANITVSGTVYDSTLQMIVNRDANEAYLESVSMQSDKPGIAVGETQSYTVTGRMSDGTAANLSQATVRWRILNRLVAKVNDSGVVTGTGAGADRLYAEVILNGVKRSVSTLVSVTDGLALASVSLTGSRNALLKGDELALTLSGIMNNGIHANLKHAAVQYQSSNPEAVTVDSSGKVAARSLGTSFITAQVSLNGVTRSASYAVSVLPGSVHIYNFNALEIISSSTDYTKEYEPFVQLEANESGHSIAFSFDVPEANTYQVGMTAAKWTSFGRYNVRIDGHLLSEFNFNGLENSADFEPLGEIELSAGTHEIAFENTGKDAEATNYKMAVGQLRLKAEPTVSELTLSGLSSPMLVGDQAQIVVNALFNEGTKMNVTVLASLHSSVSDAVSFTDTGVMTATRTGATLITASFGNGTTAPFQLSINAVPPSPPSPSPAAGTDPAIVIRAGDVKPSQGKFVVKLGADKSQVVLPAKVGEWLNGGTLEVAQADVLVEIPSGLLMSIASRLSPEQQKDATITLSVRLISQANRQFLLEQASAKKGTPIRAAGEAVHLEWFVTTADGKAVQISKLDQPVKLSLKLAAATNPSLTGIYYIGSDGTLAYVGGIIQGGRLEAELSHLSDYAALEYDKSYGDVPSGHWALLAIKVLSAKQIVEGVSGSRYDPDRAITRAEAAALIVKALQLKATDQPAFADVAADAWYAAAVAAAAENGIVKGFGDHTFRPDEKITREQMAAMLMNALQLKGQANHDGITHGAFADEDRISDWARAAVSFAHRQGLINGKGGNRMDPQGACTRAESAQMIYNLLNISVHPMSATEGR